MIDRSKKKLARQLSQMMLQLIEERPLLVWGAVLTLVLSVASMTATGLTSPGPADREEIEVAAPPKPQESEGVPPSARAESFQTETPQTETPQTETPQTETPQTESSQNNSALLLWLFLMIAVGCASGSWLISKHLLHLHRQYQFSKPPKLKRRSPSKIRQKTVVMRPPQTLQQPPQRQVTATVMQPIPVAPEPMVTVVPAEEIHPLDWDKNNLAEMMDIRKRHSLSSVMRKSR